jgi:hypothetical protein
MGQKKETKKVIGKLLKLMDASLDDLMELREKGKKAIEEELAKKD